MRDVHEQLADYFDAAVERITAEDVFAGVQTRARVPAVPEASTASLRPRLSPAWAIGVTFVTTLVVISGSLGLGLLLRATSGPPGLGGTAQVPAGTDTTGSLVFFGGALAALVAIGIAAAVRRGVAARRNGGATMTATTERPLVDDRVHRLEHRNRTLTITVIVLAVLAIGLGAWAVYQAATATEELSAPDGVMSMTDDWVAALGQHDGSVLDLYVESGYHLYGDQMYSGVDMAVHLGGAQGQKPYGTHEWTGDPTVMVAGEGRWVVVRPMYIAAGSAVESTVSFEIVETVEGSYRIVHTSWMVDHGANTYAE